MSKRGRFTPSFPAEGSTAVLDHIPETAAHRETAYLESIAALTGGQDGSVDPSGTFIPETAPEVIPAPAATPQTPSSESPDALRARLAAIPQETLRKIAAEHQGGAVELPDGSLRFPAIIPPEICEVVRAWAEGAGMDFDSYMQQHILTCLTSGTLA